MLPRNKLYLFLLVFAVVLPLVAQVVPATSAPQSTPTQTGQPAAQPPASTEQAPAQNPVQTPEPAQNAPTNAAPQGEAVDQQQAPPTTPPAGGQAGNAGQAGTAGQAGQAGQGRAPDSQQGDTFVFTTTVQNVVLHATVIDDKNHIVNNLDKNAFTVFEDGQPQRLIQFKHEDIPVALGIVIDNSGSMRDKRPKVNQAAINLVRASNPDDQVFIVNFNDEYYLDQDYTANVGLLKEALERIEARGGTALYDAIVASADHLKHINKPDKKVLLVVTDGEDNASRESLEQAIRRLQAENGPVVYTIGLLGEERQRRAKRALQSLAEDTGGVSFFPKDLSQVDEISQEIAKDIRNQYTLVYKPSVPQSKGGYRTIKVQARAKGYKSLTVRTRNGYYAGQQQAALQ